MTKHRRLLVRFNFVLSILMTHPFLLAQESPPTTAVLDFESWGVSETEALTLTDRFRTSIGNTGTVRLVERSLMEEILREQDFQLTGCTSDECAVEVGQLLGVQYMIGGSIGKVGETYTIDARMISVETGASVRTRDVTYLGEVDGLIIEIEILAYEMAGLDPPPEILGERKSGKEVPKSQQWDLIPAPTGAVMRSLLIPGWGQFYSGNKGKGILFIGATAASIGGAIKLHIMADDAYKIYQQNTPEVVEYRKIAIEYDKKSLYLLLVSGSFWVYNIFDAYVFTNKKRVNVTLEAQPYRSVKLVLSKEIF